MLGKNWNIITTYSPLQPIAMPPVQNNSVVPKKQASKVWRYLGDNLDGAIAKCLLCTYNPTKGDAHKSSLVNRYSSSQVQPWSSRFAKAPPKPWETTCKHKTRGIWWRRRSRRRRRSSRCPTEWRTKSFQLLPDELSAASSKSEQAFSVAGNVVTPKRANPEKVEDLVVVKCNLSIKVAKEHGLH